MYKELKHLQRSVHLGFQPQNLASLGTHYLRSPVSLLQASLSIAQQLRGVRAAIEFCRPEIDSRSPNPAYFPPLAWGKVRHTGLRFVAQFGNVEGDTAITVLTQWVLSNSHFKSIKERNKLIRGYTTSGLRADSCAWIRGSALPGPGLFVGIIEMGDKREEFNQICLCQSYLSLPTHPKGQGLWDYLSISQRL